MAEEKAKKEVSSKKMDAKAMLKEHGEKGTKIRYNSRKKVEVIVDTKFYKKGRILNPHVVMADQLIKDGIAKEVRN